MKKKYNFHNLFFHLICKCIGIANNANKIPIIEGIVNKVEFLRTKKRFLKLFDLLI